MAVTLETPTGSQAKVDVHVNDATAAHAASAIAFTPTGTIAATTVQAAIAEVASEAAGATNLAYTPAAGNGVVTSDTGTDATLTAADGTNAGLMLPAAFTKLAGIEAGATADQTAAEILAALLTVDGTGSGLDADLLDGNSSAAFVTAAMYDANTILAATADNTPIALSVPTSRIVGRKATGDITAMSGAEVTELLSGASDTQFGIVELATSAETITGTDTIRAVTPAGAAAAYQPLDSDLTALAALTTTSYGRAFLALANQAATMALLSAASDTAQGIVELATSAETITGTDATRANTPAGGAAAYQALAQAVNAQTGTTYTLVAGDVGKLVSLSNAGAITLTLPQDSDATIAIGAYVDLYQLGAGQVTVVAGTGATLRVSGLTAKARAQYARFGVQKVSANTFSLYGDLAAS